MISLGAIAHRGREIVIAQTHGSVGELPAERGHHFRFLEERESPQRRVDTPYSCIIPIQNIVLLPTSTSYFRTKSSLPSLPMRNTERHAGTWRTFAPSRTNSGLMCAATSRRPLGSMWNVRQWMPCVSV